MSDPKRLSESAHNRVEENLLRSALNDEAPEGTRDRALAAVGSVFAGYIAAAAVAPSHVSASAAKYGALKQAAAMKVATATKAATLAKVAGVVGIVGAGAVAQHFSAPRPAQFVAPPVPRVERGAAEPVAPSVVEQRQAPLVAEVAEVELAPTPVRAVVPAPRVKAQPPRPPPMKSPPVKKDALAEQLALLAQARERLDLGAPGEAIRLLDEYARRFPDGTLRPEAEGLKRRALERAAQNHWVDIERAAREAER